MLTANEVRNAFARDWLADAGESAESAERRGRAAFDEWLVDVKRIVWHQGASSRQCHCNAYSEGECACGGYPSERNPYI